MNNYFLKQILESKDKKGIADFMSAISNSEVFIRAVVQETMEDLLDQNGISSWSNDQIRGVQMFLEKYVEVSDRIEKVYTTLKKKKVV